MNRYAALGALVTTEKDGGVQCECVIQSKFIEAQAGVVAAASIHARPSILEALRRTFGQKTSPAIERLSAWTDLDFEQLHYDYAHLGIGQLTSRRFTIDLYPFGSLNSMRFIIIPIGAAAFYV